MTRSPRSDVELTKQETEQLEKPYVPHRIAGHI